MPLYSYYCEACKQEQEHRHRMSVVLEDCEICNSKSSLVKMVNTISDKSKVRVKVGDIVKNSIKEAKQEFAKEQRKYRKDL